MVKEGEAAIAAIDCVTYGYLKQEQPESVSGIKILQYTAPTPGLPLIAASAVPETVQTRLRNALLSPDAVLREHMQSLHIKAFQACTDAEYERILRLESVAMAAGYPELA
jgi:ABC-type phosphate/phosphonate transport system substrate-binding protein